MNGLPPEEWNAAMVFQTYNLYPHLTVFDNIAFPLRSLHMPREELEETVLEAAGLLQMDHLLDRLPGDLSGGEQQPAAGWSCRSPRGPGWTQSSPLGWTN